MKRIKQLLVILLITLVVTLGAVGCDSGKATTQEATTSSTVVETTVTTTHTEIETTLPETTVSETTIEVTTVLPTTETTTITTTAATTMATTVATTAATTTAAQTTIVDTTAGTTVSSTVATTTETTTETTTTSEDGDQLVLTSPTTTVYEVFDSLNLSGLVVHHIDSTGSSTELNENDYTVSSVDMTTYGTKEVVVEYQTYATSFLINVNLPSYLTSATDLDGNTLFLQLRTIVNNGFSGVTYGEARYILDETDRDPNNSSNLIQVYTGDSVPGAWNCSGSCVWNREHTWPQSAMPGSASNGTVNTASDLHNLKPSDPGENSFRGNKYFSNTSTSASYEPRDEVKGDVARIMLYMVVMYDALTLVDGTPNIDNYEMGLLSVLLDWNELDPVDDFERNRNQVIYSYQGNYNPFILYPDFADLIWD